MNIFLKLKPSVPNRYLMFTASVVWTFAGCMLLTKGLVNVFEKLAHPYTETIIGIIAGGIFYFFVFSKVSLKHIRRIQDIKIEKPCLFSFFDVRSYILMGCMIILGITVRKLDVINKDILFPFYITMGIPLLISAFRFFKTWKSSS